MFASWSLAFIIVWSPLVIQLSRAKFLGDPIRVTAKFQVSDEMQPEFALRTMNQSIDYILDDGPDKEAKLVRPRPYLSANGQIEFHLPEEEVTSPPTTAR